MPDPITSLPAAPARTDPPATFVSKADSFIAALPNFVSEVNAFASALNAYATNSTSASSLAIGTGSKSLTVEAGKSYVPGMSVKIAYTTTPANYMLGYVTSYNSGTGALVVNVTETGGSGTYAAWTVSQAFQGLQDGGVTFAKLAATLISAATALAAQDPAADYLMIEDASAGGLRKIPLGSIGVGKQTIWIPAGAMTQRTTSGAAFGIFETPTYKLTHKTLDFDAAADEFAQFTIRMPKGWNEGTVTAYFLWSATNTGGCVWGINAVALGDDDFLDADFGSSVSVVDSVTIAGDLMQTTETAAITIAGAPAAGDLVVFQVFRNASHASDTLAVDARLHGVALIYTTDANHDA